MTDVKRPCIPYTTPLMRRPHGHHTGSLAPFLGGGQFNCAQNDKSRHAADHPSCRFGHWFRSSGGVQYGQQAAYGRLGRQHDEIHRIANELLALARSGHAPEVRTRMSELTEASTAMIKTMSQLMDTGEGCSICASGDHDHPEA